LKLLVAGTLTLESRTFTRWILYLMVFFGKKLFEPVVDSTEGGSTSK
jgi:hypothetical protein